MNGKSSLPVTDNIFRILTFIDLLLFLTYSDTYRYKYRIHLDVSNFVIYHMKHYTKQEYGINYVGSKTMIWLKIDYTVRKHRGNARVFNLRFLCGMKIYTDMVSIIVFNTENRLYHILIVQFHPRCNFYYLHYWKSLILYH